MNFFFNMLNLQLMLFALILLGILAKKLKMITRQMQKALSDLLINFILPCNIVSSFMSDITISSDFIRNCTLALVLSLIIQFIAVYGSRLFFLKYPMEKKNVMSYGMICSNSSFIGLPVAEALYGSLGVLYTSIFQIPIRLMMWTSGLALFTNINKKDALRKLATHPCIVSIVVGFILMLLPVNLPSFAADTITALSRCTIPVSMLVIGSILADANLKTLFTPSVLYFTFLRLIAFPIVIYLVLLPFHLDSMLVRICVLLTGMPAGSTTSILADKYDCDAMFASQIMFVSTLLSIVTIPLLSIILAG